jgi:predicted TIM-barrel fold metal-dependent hydrolase
LLANEMVYHVGLVTAISVYTQLKVNFIMICNVLANQPPSRRRFLKTAASLAVVSGMIAPVARCRADENVPAEPSEPPRIDCHVHCFAGANDPLFPYHALAPYEPAEAATPEHLLDCMNGAGVAAAIIVHPEPYQDDHRYLKRCLELGGGRLKGTALVFADRPGATAQLTELAEQMPIVATRVHAYAPDRLPPFGSRALRELWQTASGLGLAMQLHFEPRYAAGFEPLIREFNQTTVIIDHLGRPFQGTPQEHRIVLRWGELPNTLLKVSSIPERAAYPHRDIRPVINDLIDAYGADRMLYGGGFGATATAASHRAAFDRAASYLGNLSDADQAKVLGGNAKRLFFA